MLLLLVLWALAAGLLGHFTFYQTVICRYLSRVLLFITGFYEVQLKEFMVKFGSVGAPLSSWSIVPNRGTSLLSNIHTSDWIISSHASYLDPFVMAHIFSPTFYSLTRLKAQGLLSFFYSQCNVGCMDGYPDLASATKLDISPKKGPHLLFPERTTENGRGLLKFDPLLDQLDLDQREHRAFLCVIKYPTSCFIHGSIARHWLGLLMSWRHTVEVSVLPLSDYHLLRGGLYSSDSTLRSHGTGHLLAHIMSLFGKIRPTSLTWRDKADFIRYYLSKQGNKAYSSRE